MIAAKLREVCALISCIASPARELTGWCLRMLAEPGAAEHAVTEVERITDGPRMDPDAVWA